MKNATSGLILAASIYALWQLFQLVWVIAVVFMPVILLVGGLYLIGYYAPKEIHDNVQTWIRDRLDWVAFNQDLSWAWPWVLRARRGLDWLGIQVTSKP